MLEPIFENTTGDSNDTMFINNSAGEYGNDIACFAERLEVVNSTVYDDMMIKLGLMNNSTLRALYEASTNVSAQRSGGNIPTTYVAHVDKYGQIVGSDFTSIVRVSVNASSNMDP